MGFVREENAVRYLNEQGEKKGEVTFPALDANTVEIDHTFVDPSMRGTGLAGKLMKEAAEQIQAEEKKAVLTCSYAVQWFERHPEYSGIVKK
ncbi:MAG TPA: N-acetyltransferase [Candidatus Blautia merdavium]|uniref:N-acetyltransferase n=1 Tax=Candidatus Blautia merdavium TaxID=2838494 RepID=A0A9D2PPS6_9FIRM|nr:N-acetyltransferase [Candidatus Blautia merdavium]